MYSACSNLGAFDYRQLPVLNCTTTQPPSNARKVTTQPHTRCSGYCGAKEQRKLLFCTALNFFTNILPGAKRQHPTSQGPHGNTPNKATPNPETPNEGVRGGNVNHTPATVGVWFYVRLLTRSSKIMMCRMNHPPTNDDATRQ
ncbi:hypothetical protein BS47DRAFT_1369147 [Hydnum rufescens UP504]|uniref:Uncharacterized protein n=1 Tax=Hydnum rufescens UP504 TaxID=1448309 RepID=A0A9P6ADM9_9AGAM|nr:hypothetical protein BS47DRAFT_1369147 [Hydnum rufescens UP504]